MEVLGSGGNWVPKDLWVPCGDRSHEVMYSRGRQLMGFSRNIKKSKVHILLVLKAGAS